MTDKPKHKRVQLTGFEPSITQQAHKDGAEINNIIARYRKTGIAPMSGKQPIFGDYTDAGSFHDAMNKVAKGKESFMQLPAQMRKKFDNDPVQFLQFLQDPKNRDEAVKMGLMKAPDAPATPPTGDRQTAPANGPEGQQNNPQ